MYLYLILDSIVVSIPACHAGGRGSIPRRGEIFLIYFLLPIRLQLHGINNNHKYFLLFIIKLIFFLSIIPFKILT